MIEDGELITIIIPIYKVEKYIKKCINTVLEQTYKNLEVILVDDGSPDKCGEICEEYAKKDNRIQVIHKKNGGLSDARNEGIERANGKYILLVDSDDYLEKDAVEYLYKIAKINNADITIGQANLIYENTNIKYSVCKKENNDIKIYNTEEALSTMLYNTEFTNNAWNKLYKIDLFQKIRYPVGKLYEDLGTTYKLISKSNIVALGYKNTYNYLVDRQDSIMNNNFDIKRMQGLDFTEEILEFVQKEYPNAVKGAIARLYMECIFILLKIPYGKEYKNENKRIRKYLRRYRKEVITDKKMPKKQKILCIATIFGRIPLKLVWNLKEVIKRSGK